MKKHRTGLRVSALAFVAAALLPASSAFAQLDLIVDPGTREVRVRSEDGPRAFLLRVAA